MENISNIASAQDDGAGEKLVGDEKNGHNSKGNIEVRYMTPTSQNGDAKIDIENLKNAFAGMGKEELMKFANDPFWVRTRWFLFFLFWFLWAAMLAGAIAIIVLAPKCAAPLPREWWEQSPAYKINVPAFSGEKSSALAGVTTKLDYLIDLGIKSVILPPIVDMEKESYTSISSYFGTLEDLKTLISTAKKNGINLLLTLFPNYSVIDNPLFNKSASRVEPFTSYFVWAPATKGYDDAGIPIPPNNWLSVHGGSAWEWHEGRKEFYLHQFSKNQPDFNFRNPAVVKYFTDAFKYWLNLGISGLYLENSKYLLEDIDLKDAVRGSKPGLTHNEYEFYDHSRTTNVVELPALLQQFTGAITNNSGIVFFDDVLSPRNRSVGNLVLNSQVLKSNFDATNLNQTITSRLASNSWPSWQLCSEDDKQNQTLNLLSLLLPGTPIIHSGQELGLPHTQLFPWYNYTDTTSDVEDVSTQQKNPDSIYYNYKVLIETRKSHSILYGTLETHVFNSTSGSTNVFAYTRIKSGNPGYLVVYNTAASNETISLQDFTSVPDEVTVIARTELLQPSLHLKSKIDSNAVTLPGYSLAVFSFVPEAKET